MVNLKCRKIVSNNKKSRQQLIYRHTFGKISGRGCFCPKLQEILKVLGVLYISLKQTRTVCLSNDPGTKGSNFFCCGAIRFPHIVPNAQTYKKAVYEMKCIESPFLEGVSCVCVKRFRPIKIEQTIAKKSLQFYIFRTQDFCVTLTQTRFCNKEAGQKKRD